MKHKKYLCCPLRIVPLEGKWIVSGGRYNKKLVVHPIHLEIFRLSSVLISEVELVNLISSKFNVSQEEVKQLICEFVDKGFLVCDEFAVPSLSTSKKDHRKIEYLGIITCDRPQALCEALEMYIKNAYKNGHDLTFFVVDDSRHSQKENKKNIAHIAKELRCPVGYIGDSERRELIQLVSEGTGFSKELVSFAFYPNGKMDTVRFSAGAARNCGVAFCAGAKYLLADDDSLPIGNNSTANRELSFSQGMPPLLKSFNRECQEKESNCDIDVISYIKKYLGKTTREILEEHGSVDVGHYFNNTPVLVDKLKNFLDVRIGFSMCTIQGVRDISVDTYLDDEYIHDGWYFERADSDCICSSPLLLTTTLTGFDSKQFVVPFFPIYRNEDVMTSMFLNSIDTYALSVTVNANLWHKKEKGHQEITYSKSNFYEEILFPKMLESILKNYYVSVPGSILPNEKRINMVKEYIEGICAEDSSKFISNICTMDYHLLEVCSKKMDHIKKLRKNVQQDYAYWRTYPKNKEELLSSNNIEMFRKALLQYVALLKVWDQILNSCEVLKETSKFPVTMLT